MKLLELLDTGYSYEWKYPDQAVFLTNKHESVRVDFQNQDGVWMVAFYRDNKWKMTGGGDALKIYTTVGRIIKAFLNKHKIKMLGFSSDKSETSRTKFYQTWFKKKFPDLTRITLDNVDLLKEPHKKMAHDWLSRLNNRHPSEEWMLYVEKTTLA